MNLTSGQHLVDVIERVPVFVIPCLTSYHLEHEAEAARILGIPDDVTQAGLLPVAYTTTTSFKPGPRQPVADLTYLDSWGNSFGSP